MAVYPLLRMTDVITITQELECEQATNVPTRYLLDRMNLRRRGVRRGSAFLRLI